MKTIALHAVLLSALILAVLPVAAHEPPPGDSPRVIALTFTLGGPDIGKNALGKAYRLVVEEGETVSLSRGARVPIPARVGQTSEDGKPVPVVSYSYQNVGFQAHAEAQVLTDGSIRVGGRVEASAFVASDDHPGQPIITTLDQSVAVVVSPGETVLVVSIESEGAPPVSLAVRAEVLD